MLRPERMSRVSVTGSKAVMLDVIEAVHDLDVLHITEYDGSVGGFDPGNPAAGADDASSKLVTVRALKSTLGVEPADAGPTRLVTDQALEEELEEIRTTVNDLDDRRDALQRDIRSVEDDIERMEFFVELGIDLELLSGYDSLSVAVGRGDPDTVRAALADADTFDAADVFDEGSTLAAYAYPADDEALENALVGADFTAVEIPDGEGDPESYLEELRHRRQKLGSRLSTVENELEELKLDVAGFLLAAEEQLSIEVRKREAPLTFATTQNAFVAEGWLPSDEVEQFESALRDRVGDHVAIDELERAEYDEEGIPEEREQVSEGGNDEAVATDGGIAAFGGGEPPIVQDNPGPAKPFEVLVEAFGLPSYDELDPTVILLLTFPLFFGFMIGDVGYGLTYMAIGAAIAWKLESPALRSLGGVAIWAGAFTVVFGFLFGEIFGTHQISSLFWEGIVGMDGAPIHKGMMPAYSEYASLWFVVSILLGILHLTIGYAFGFLNDLSHGLKTAILEDGSWLLMLFGIWAAIFSKAAPDLRPTFLYEIFAREDMLIPGTDQAVEAVVIPLGFNGLPAVFGTIGLGMFVLGLVMLAVAEPVEIVESLEVLVHALSYVRLLAVILAKVVMAFVVNLIFFGGYITGTGDAETYHFAISHMPEVGQHVHGYEHPVSEIMFGGLMHMGVAGFAVGLVILVVGHMFVLALGAISGGIQAVRLQYVEFFTKFYDGNGTPYEPFGSEREFTAGE